MTEFEPLTRMETVIDAFHKLPKLAEDGSNWNGSQAHALCMLRGKDGTIEDAKDSVREIPNEDLGEFKTWFVAFIEGRAP
jgi:hypothetical protein